MTAEEQTIINEFDGSALEYNSYAGQEYIWLLGHKLGIVLNFIFNPGTAT